MVQTHFAVQNSARNAVGKIQKNESKSRHFTNGNALQTAILTGIRRFFGVFYCSVAIYKWYKTLYWANSARNAVGKIQTNESKRRHFTNGNALQTAILTGIRRFFVQNGISRHWFEVRSAQSICVILQAKRRFFV